MLLPLPLSASLYPFPLHSGGQPQGTRMAQGHAWGSVRSHGRDELGTPGLHQTANIPMLSVQALLGKATWRGLPCLRLESVNSADLFLQEVRQPLYFTMGQQGPHSLELYFYQIFSCLVYGLLKSWAHWILPATRLSGCASANLPLFAHSPLRGWMPP